MPGPLNILVRTGHMSQTETQIYFIPSLVR